MKIRFEHVIVAVMICGGLVSSLNKFDIPYYVWILLASLYAYFEYSGMSEQAALNIGGSIPPDDDEGLKNTKNIGGGIPPDDDEG